MSAATPRPQALPPDFDRIPLMLRDMPAWVLWTYALNEKGKWTKVPLTVTRRSASTTNPATWSSFDDVRQAYKHGGFDGVGMVLTDGIAGADLDKVIDDDGAIESWAKDALEQFQNTYRERSPSGRGFRIFARGQPPRCGKGGPGNRLEVYAKDSPRYLTVTGQALDDVTEVAEAQPSFDWLHATFMEKPQKRIGSNRDEGLYGARPDEEILRRARDARNGAKFGRLWDGEGSDYPSSSEADAALIGLLAFWTQGTACLDRLFRRSGLMREKWDERRGESTYGAHTIAAVLAMGGERYNWARAGGNSGSTAGASGKEASGPQDGAASAPGNDFRPPEEPQNLFEVEVPPPLDMEAALPDVLREFAVAHAHVAGHDPTAYGYAAIAAAASVLPHGTTIALSPVWSEPLVAWVALVGPSGSGKTPAMSAAVAPVEALHLEGERRYQAEQAAQEHEKSRGEQAKRSGYYFTDCTIEALIARAASASHGVLRFADEGTAWLNAMGRYAAADHGERGIWLAAWNGKPYTVTRIVRGDAHLPAWTVGLLYGITPARLKEAYEDAAADGMLARTLICLTSSNMWVPARPDSQIGAIRDRYDAAIRAAAREVRALTFSDQAAARWKALQLEYRETALATAEMAPGLSAFLFKAPTMAARLAGLFATLEGAAVVTSGSMERAAHFMQHATITANIAHQQVFAVAQPVGIARRLATKILTAGGARVTRREFARVDAFAKASPADQGAAINYLAGAAWLTEADVIRTRLGPRFHEATAWRVNPLVHDRFADIADKERRAAADAVAKLDRLTNRA